ncbi:MAG: hypothetical protein AB7U34_00020 [Novosphingobium sp.]
MTASPVRWRKPSDAFLLLALSALAGCSGGTADSPGAPLIVDGDYLEGTWCYERFESPTRNVMENITYIFEDDGDLTFQPLSGSSIDEKGHYKFDKDDGVLRIGPQLSLLEFKPLVLNPDRMVFSVMDGKAYWVRGACKPA